MATHKRRKPYAIECRFSSIRPKSIFSFLNIHKWHHFRRYCTESARNQALAVLVKKAKREGLGIGHFEYRKKEDLHEKEKDNENHNKS